MERPPTILVADDDADQRELLADLLGLEGFQVLTAGSPSDTSRALEGGVDLLLLDLHGALDDRLEQLLGQLGDRRPALVVASGDPDIQHHARRLHADGVLAKPFGLEDLLATVRAGVRARRGGQTV
jgi:two-component system OmpR family response regulator